VINIKNKQTPVVHLTEEVIDFLSSIGVSLDIDIYIYS